MDHERDAALTHIHPFIQSPEPISESHKNVGADDDISNSDDLDDHVLQLRMPGGMPFENPGALGLTVPDAIDEETSSPSVTHSVIRHYRNTSYTAIGCTTTMADGHSGMYIEPSSPSSRYFTTSSIPRLFRTMLSVAFHVLRRTSKVPESDHASMLPPYPPAPGGIVQIGVIQSGHDNFADGCVNQISRMAVANATYVRQIAPVQVGWNNTANDSRNIIT